MSIKKIFGIAFACFFTSTSSANDAPHPWSTMATMDLSKIKETIEQHHPAPLDTDNAEFTEWLEQGFHSANFLASKAKSFEDYSAAVALYVDGFNDGHISVKPFLRATSIRWAQLNVRFSQNKFYVKADGATYPDLTDTTELLSCDGEDIFSLLQENVFPYNGVSGLEAETHRLAPHLFIAHGHQFERPIKQCTFMINGTPAEIKLQWVWLPPEQIKRHIQPKSVQKFELVEFAEARYRVAIPTFSVGQNPDDIQQLIETLKEHAKTLVSAKTLVFDMRGNQGGSSAWAKKIITSVFGESSTENARLAGYDSIDWRISRRNIESQAWWRDYWAKKAGEEDPITLHYAELVDNMNLALVQGESIYTIEPEQKRIPNDDTTPAYQVAIYLLTDYECFSACLDMADLVLSIPNAQHLGAPTRADAIYIDNRSFVLPSGNGRFSFSMKAYRGRVRGHNQAYIPSIRYDDPDWSSTAIDAWLKNVTQ